MASGLGYVLVSPCRSDDSTSIGPMTATATYLFLTIRPWCCWGEYLFDGELYQVTYVYR